MTLNIGAAAGVMQAHAPGSRTVTRMQRERDDDTLLQVQAEAVAMTEEIQAFIAELHATSPAVPESTALSLHVNHQLTDSGLILTHALDPTLQFYNALQAIQRYSSLQSLCSAQYATNPLRAVQNAFDPLGTSQYSSNVAGVPHSHYTTPSQTFFKHPEFFCHHLRHAAWHAELQNHHPSIPSHGLAAPSNAAANPPGPSEAPHPSPPDPLTGPGA